MGLIYRLEASHKLLSRLISSTASDDIGDGVGPAGPATSYHNGGL